MEPELTGKKYDNIAQWWQERHQTSDYGVAMFERALQFCPDGGQALDVGCGAGGRFIERFEARHFQVTGLDVSREMIRLASQQHPVASFIQQDICTWETTATFDCVWAWDSLFHLPLEQHEPVISGLCQQLKPGGVLCYTFGNDHGEHTDQWHDDQFYYSSIGIHGNVQLLMQQGVNVVHLELDQYPERHVCVIAQKPALGKRY